MQVKTFNPYKDLDKVFKWYRDVIVQTDSTWLENGRDCSVNSKLQVARWPDCMFLLTVLLSSSSHAVRVQWLTVAPPMLTQSVCRIPNLTTSSAYIPWFREELLTQ